MTEAMIEEGFEKGRDSSRVYMRDIADVRSYVQLGALGGLKYEKTNN